MMNNADKQFLLNMTKRTITELEDIVGTVRMHNQELYEMCNPNDPNTKEVFDTLNQNRNGVRKAKQIIKRLARISKELKKELRT